MREYGFSPSIREQVREEQDRTCAHCGRKGRERLQVHHRVPRRFISRLQKDKMIDAFTLQQFKEYIQSKKNAVALCNRCHRYWDEVSHQFVYFGFEKPLGIPVERR